MDRKKIFSWCLFDFANSSYSAVIASVIFPIYYTAKIVGDSSGLGDLWWGRAVSLSMLIVALTSPLLGGIADFSGIRKRMLFVFVSICVVCVASLSTLKEGQIIRGFMLFVLANIAMEWSVIFYNSFLPVITPTNYLGRVSSWGFGIGYLGSIVSLLIGLYLVQKGHYGLVWISVSLFFFIFSLPVFFMMPKDERKEHFFQSAIKGMRYIIDNFKRLWMVGPVRVFLIAYFLYIDGVNTVIVFSSIYASVTVGFSANELVLLFIFVQFTAFMGSFVFARFTDIWGPRRVIELSLVLWSAVSSGAFFVDSKRDFFILASLAGVGLGTIQASSRAYFSKFIPYGKQSEYFGVYSMVGKSSSILGPFLFGVISSLTGSQRYAILIVLLFFISGLLLIRRLHNT